MINIVVLLYLCLHHFFDVVFTNGFGMRALPTLFVAGTVCEGGVSTAFAYGYTGSGKVRYCPVSRSVYGHGHVCIGVYWCMCVFVLFIPR
jgi:hypothetical protein